MNNDELQHHGVKGMRWGHRNAKTPNDSDSKSKDRAAKTAKGKKVVGTILAVAGGLAVTAAALQLTYKYGMKTGRMNLQNEITAARRAAAQRGAATRATIRSILASVDV